MRDVRLIRSPISVAGMVLTTASAAVFIVVLLADLFGLHTNPYLGILFFLVLPAIFVVGLLLIPLGAFVERRRSAAGKPPSAVQWPRLDLNNPATRTTAVIVFLLTLANIVIVSLGAYRGLEYMDSVSFCGSVCHTAMQPQLTAHLQGTHARVACVECHVGTGATGFVRAKWSGVHRVVAVATHAVPTPIVAAPAALVPAIETCENCHAPGHYKGDVVKKVAEYSDAEKAEATLTTLQLHVGGRDATGASHGIHWHADPATAVEFVAADKERQTIPWIRVTDARGTREYVTADGQKARASATPRRMDCTDCHNRPSHAIAATPERAVDAALANGEIALSLPYARREAVKALKVSYASRDAAAEAIATALRAAYGAPGTATAPAAADVDRAVRSVQGIYARSVFPEMQVTFGTYANNIGHMDSAGCFRCHDDDHKTQDGKALGQDCDTCHAIE